MSKELPKKAKSQPVHVCASCGKEYGVWYRVDEMTRENLMGVGWYSGTWALPPSWVTGRCGVCQEVRSVTEPVVYGGLVEYWQPRLAFD